MLPQSSALKDAGDSSVKMWLEAGAKSARKVAFDDPGAKAALESTVRYLASDLGPQNIRVNAISAGPVKTLASSGVSGFTSMLQLHRERAPLRRSVESAEVAETALFLLSPAGSGITGDTIMVDVGYHIMGM